MMEDRFKFRVWDIEEKIMSPVLEIHSHLKGLDIVGYDYKLENKTYQKTMSIYLNSSDNECILMQCTGLKDKNGKLIYEGDILKENDKLWIVYWNKYQFSIKKIHKTGHYNLDNWHLARHNLDYAVIGNIHENPELLAK